MATEVNPPLNTIKRLVITAGEPAGIGPDLALSLAQHDFEHQLILCANKQMLQQRAKQLNINVDLIDYQANSEITAHQRGRLFVCDEPLASPVVAGELDSRNAQYVLNTLTRAATGCLNGEFAALLTGPVQKSVINQAGIPFTGHTEFLQTIADVDQVVMMLATQGLRVALATTHLPLSEVPKHITKERLTRVIRILHHDLQHNFGIKHPKILVAGLNPHAGENGSLGMEEIEVITPTLNTLRAEGLNLVGPLPADTLFQDKYLQDADAVLAMYHDQGLPVLKFKGFGQAVNITLGLPFIRTSVDHGTALDLAGTGKADTGSLHTALAYSLQLMAHQASPTHSN